MLFLQIIILTDINAQFDQLDQLDSVITDGWVLLK